jgi:hypothetical protein
MGNKKSAPWINEEAASFNYPVVAQQDSSAAEMGEDGEVPRMTGPPDMNIIYRLIDKAPQVGGGLSAGAWYELLSSFA